MTSVATGHTFLSWNSAHLFLKALKVVAHAKQRAPLDQRRIRVDQHFRWVPPVQETLRGA